MSERDFDLGNRKFKLNKINAFEQFHIARRIAPILSDLLPLLKDIKKSVLTSDTANESDKLDEVAKMAGPVMNGLSKLSDEDANRVLFGLLSSVEMQQSTGNWLRVASSTMVMVQDLELPNLLQIAGRAFVYNLSGFFGALPPK